MRFLLDANVLIALADEDHTVHARATVWFQQEGRSFATCPITQGALIRHMLRVKPGATVGEARLLLVRVEALEGHEFWPDSISYAELPEAGVRGHHQVTDAYLVALARQKGGRLATLDRALAAVHPDVAVLIP